MSKFKEFEKLYGKLPGDDVLESKKNKEEVKNNILANIIIFVFQLFITGPNKNYKNPLLIVSMGLVLFSTNAFFLFSESKIKAFISFFDFSSNIKILMTAFVYIYLIIQFIRGIWIIGGWNQNGNVRSYLNQSHLDSIVVDSNTRPYYTQDTNVLPDAIGETYDWMNSQMQSMSNSQRESYLRDFYGGNKN